MGVGRGGRNPVPGAQLDLKGRSRLLGFLVVVGISTVSITFGSSQYYTRVLAIFFYGPMQRQRTLFLGAVVALVVFPSILDHHPRVSSEFSSQTAFLAQRIATCDVRCFYFVQFFRLQGCSSWCSPKSGNNRTKS